MAFAFKAKHLPWYIAIASFAAFILALLFGCSDVRPAAPPRPWYKVTTT